jgi:thymidylate kinase
MKVIELCGNPGSGKSTIAKRLIEQLKMDGYFVIDVRRPYDNYHGILKEYIKNKIAFMYRIDTKARKLSCLFQEFTRENTMEQNKKWAAHFQRLAYVYSWANGKCDFLIADEGPIQYLTSFYYQSEITGIPEDIKLKIRSTFYDSEYCVLSISTPLEENVRRIKDRDRVNDRFNLSSIEDITRLLKIKNTNVQNVIRFLDLQNVHIIDNSSDIETVISKTVDAIHGCFG